MGTSYIPSNYKGRTGTSVSDYKYHFQLWFEEAKRIKREHNLAVPAEAILAQWAHETGHFSSGVFKSNHNLAGLTYSGKTYKLLSKGTSRPSGEGGSYLKAASFQTAADAYAEFLMSNARWKEFTSGGSVTTVKGAFEAWAKGGWAANGTYVESLWQAYNSMTIKGRNAFGDSYDYAAANTYFKTRGRSAHPPIVTAAGKNAVGHTVSGSGWSGASISKLLTIARSFIGQVKYVWGGENLTKKPYGADCSYFLQFVWIKAGGSSSIGRTTSVQSTKGTKITNRDDLQPGDFIFFATNDASPGKVSHVGLVSDKKDFMIHCGTSHGVEEVSYLNSYWKPRFLFARRYIGTEFAGTITASSGSSTSFNSVDLTGDTSRLAELGLMFYSNGKSRIGGVSPNPENDPYPSHRYDQSPFVLRIGDSQFFIPPTSINHDKVSSATYRTNMRSRTSMVNKSGWADGQLTIDLMFVDIDDINGYPIAGPGGKTYYMDGFRPLMAQFHKNAMLPIRNEFINNALGIYNVVLDHFSFSTVEQFPNMLSVRLVLNECATAPYTGVPEFMYDMCFNYPVWRWFYNQLLFDKESDRNESVYLRPITQRMDDRLLFRMLDEEIVQQMQEDLIKKTADGDGRVKINPNYVLTDFKGADMRSLMSDWPLGDIIVTRVSGVMQKELARINMHDYESPIYQDFGGIHKLFEVDIALTDRAQVYALETLGRQIERTARLYRHRFVGGFVEVHNDLLNLCGVDFALIENISIATTEIDGTYMARITIREFNPNQKAEESLNGLSNDMTEFTDKFVKEHGAELVKEYTADFNDRYNTVREEYMTETLIRQMELYPDLRLPTLVTANKALKEINEWRKAKNLDVVPFNSFPAYDTDIWVEPDFYFMYPDTQQAYESVNAGDFGAKMMTLMSTGSYAAETNTDDRGHWEKVWDTLVDPLSILNELNEFYMPNPFPVNDDVEGEQIVTANQAMTTIEYPGEPLRTPMLREWGETLQMPPDEKLMSMMMYDFVRYDQRLRLNKFFPTYIMMFVDEGVWLDGRRLWNNYYAYSALNEISITKDKSSGTDIAYVSLSNVYGTFNNETRLLDPTKYHRARTFTERIAEMTHYFFYSAEDALLAAREQMETASIRAGARIHIRLGNSSNASNLPVAFNGQVTSVSDGMDMEIFAQGDGAELMNGPISGNPGDGTPNEPHNALQKYMTKRVSNYLFTNLQTFAFFDHFESYYGIEHFGWVQSRTNKEAESAWDRVADMVTEEQMNQASASKDGSSVGQGIAKMFEFIFKGAMSSLEWIYRTVGTQAQWLVGTITGNPTFIVYDVMKNIYRGSDSPSTGTFFGDNEQQNANQTGGVLQALDMLFSTARDGEKNVNFSEYGKTVWDIGQQLSMFVPEFIFGVHEHGFRSTAFFGMPHWPVKFRYWKPAGEETNLGNWFEEIKPFQQMHVINTGINLIKNDLKVSGELLTPVMTGVYASGDITNAKEGITVYADRTILREYQKRDVVDTGVLQDIFGPDNIINGLMGYVLKPIGDTALSTFGLLVSAAEFVSFGALKGMSDRYYDFADNVSEWMNEVSNMGRTAAESITIGAMQRNFMEMYQGEIIVMGDAAMKPWDLFYVDDTELLVSGTAQVGKITHTLSRRGFLSVIKPDLITSRTDGKGQRNRILRSAVNMAGSIGAGVTSRFAHTKVVEGLAERSYNKIKTLGLKTATGVDKVSKRFTSYRPINSVIDAIGDDVDEVIRKSVKTVRRAGVVGLIMAGLTEIFMQWYDKQTRYNNVIYVYPLYKATQPMVAGIKGGVHIIPNYVDPRVVDPTGSGQQAAMLAGAVAQSENLGETNSSSSSTSSSATTSSPPVTAITPVKSSTYTGSKTVVATKDYNKVIKVGLIGHPFLSDIGNVTKQFLTGLTYYGMEMTYNKSSIDRGVYSIADGVVVNVSNKVNLGYTVVVEHTIGSNRFYSSYSHLKTSSVKVSKGSNVKRGTRLATVGKNLIGLEALQLQIHIDSYTDNDTKYGVGSRVDPYLFLKKAKVLS